MAIRSDWQMVVSGEARDATGRDRLEVENPATGEVFASAPAGTAADIDDAVAAAREAFDAWRWTPPEERADWLFELADRIEAHEDELTELETLENGKPLSQSRRDVRVAAKTCRFFAGGADKFYSDSVRDTPDEVRKKVFEPYGVVGVIVPWNWPPMHTADFAAPALATGNAVVLKPAPETPLSSIRIAELADGVIPDGLFNVVSGGVEPGVALTEHPAVDMLAFTGHDRTGEKVLAAAASNITPSMMELGGKNASLVFDDADLDRAVTGLVKSAFYNSGQACSGTERLLVHEAIADDFLEAFCDATATLVVGDGRDAATQVGPLVNQGQVDKVERYLEVAEDQGAEIRAQAALPTDPALAGGYWAPPTVLDGVDPDDRIANEEVFGPVVSALTFADEAEALAIANGVDYGLTGYVWTRDVNRAHRVASQFEVGQVAVNSARGGGLGLPFGGYKRSGIGRKKDFTETLREYTQAKTVLFDLTDDEYSL